MALIPLNTFKTKTALLTTAEYTKNTCARDTGLIVDAISYDLLHGGNSQSTFAGLQYWAQTSIEIPGEVLPILSALDRAKLVCQQIVLNQPVDISGDGYTQVYEYDSPGSSESTLKIADEFDLISKIIENGTAGVTDLIVSPIPDVTTLSVNWTPNTDYKLGTIIKSNNGTIDLYYRVIVDGHNIDDLSPTSTSPAPFSIGSDTLVIQYVPVDDGMLNAANLLKLNIDFLKSEIIAYIDRNFGNGTYQDAVAYKPSLITNTKLLVDSLAFDVLSNGSTQSQFTGLQFWQIGSSTIAAKTSQTISAINRTKTIAKEIVKNITVSKTITNEFDQYIDVINPGNDASESIVDGLFTVVTSMIPAGTMPAIVPNGQITTTAGLLNAYNLLQENKRFMQEETVAWIDTQIANALSGSMWYNFEYNKEKCFRDTGYIIDSVCFDLVYSVNKENAQANRQCVQAGFYYFTRNSTPSVSLTTQSQTITCFNYLKSIVDDIITARALPATYQSTVKQVFNLAPGTALQSSFIQNQVDFTNSIIQNGYGVITERIPINIDISANNDTQNAYRLLLANKDFLVAEVVAFYDNLSNGTFNYDRIKCSRDVGYIIDSLVFDLRHACNNQAIQSGVYYYTHSGDVSKIPKERIDTIDAFNYMKTVISAVLKSTKLSTLVSYQSNVKQITNYETIATAPSSIRDNIITATEASVDLINSIITYGPIEDLNLIREPINPISASTNIDIIKAFNLLYINRQFIIAEVVGYLSKYLGDEKKRPNSTKIYTTPPGITSIVLMAQAANITDEEVKVTFAHFRNIPVYQDPATYNGFQAGNTITELVKEFIIPPNDAASLIEGKMIIESFDSILAYSSVNNSVQITLSILETANA